MAPTIPGTNCLTQAEDAIVELLANLQTFRTFCNTNTVEGARDRVYVHDIPQTIDPDSDTWNANEWLALFPCALIRDPQDSELFDVVQAARDLEIRFNLNLRFMVTFEAYAQAGLNEQDQARHFLNLCGDMLEEIVSVANLVAGQFAPTRIAPAGAFYRRSYDKLESLGDVLGWSIVLERTVE